MQLIPSISILNGQINRLTKGDYDSPIAYEESPIDLCRKFEDHGIEVIHLLDLDGAREGWPINYDIMETIVGHTGLKVILCLADTLMILLSTFTLVLKRVPGQCCYWR